MTYDEFREANTKERWKMCDAKSISYTRGSEDRLINFTRMGERFKMEREKVLGIYMTKHWDAILHYLSTGQEGPEGVEQNIFDVQNYLDLLLKMVAEKKNILHTEDVMDIPF
jgi:hypothetical protein